MPPPTPSLPSPSAAFALPHPATLLGAALLVLVLGWLDYVTGFELSFAIFYVFPVALVAWRVGRRAGLAIAVASAVAWQVSNSLAGEIHSSPAIPIWNAATRLAFFSIIVLLLARMQRALEAERQLSRTDALTGAANARAFDEKLRDSLDRYRKGGAPISVAYVDVDDFKQINDRFGHASGDALLRRTVILLKELTRTGDVVARLGGDEFAILLQESGPGATKALAARLRAGLGSVRVTAEAAVTYSVGVIACEDPEESIESILARADHGMYRAKRGGKNAVYLESEPPSSAAERRRSGPPHSWAP